MNDGVPKSSPSETITETTAEEVWEECEEEEDLTPVEINIADEVIRVAVPPKPFSPVEKISVGVVGPEVVRSFPLNFKFVLPDNTPRGELVGKPSDATVKEAAAILGLTDITRNKYSYWMTDVTQELLIAAQRQGMSNVNQVNTLNWFIFILKQMQLTSLPRKDFFGRLEEMLLVAEKMMLAVGSENIPNPCDVLKTQDNDAFFVYYSYTPPVKEEIKDAEHDAHAGKTKKKQSKQSLTSKGKPQVEVVEDEVEYGEEEGEFFDPGPPPITEKDLMTMAQLLYDVFADRLSYEIIRDVFWEEPLVEVIRISERILAPKELLPEDTEMVKSLENDLFDLESPITLDELLLPGERVEDLTEDEKLKKIQEASQQRSKDRFMQPLADAIDSAYYRKIYPDIKGISKFVFIKKKKMNQYRQEHSSKKPLTAEKASSSGRKSKAGGSDRRKSSKRKSRASTGGKRKSTAKNKRQSMKRKSKAK